MTQLIESRAVVGSHTRPAARVGQRLAGRGLVAVLGMIGAGATMYGVRLPWLSTFQGLLSQSGWDTRNGNILVAVAALAALLSPLQLLRGSTVLRWLLALTGFGIAGYAGYLLIQLYSVTNQLDGMAFASRGPGLYVAAGGGVVILATIFLPMPGVVEPAPVADESTTSAADTEGLHAEPWARTRTGLLRPVGSWLRWPAAALAALAGLAHVPVTPSHLQEAPYIGVLFIMFTIVSVLGATLLLISDRLLGWLALAGSCLLAVIAFVLSRTVGLPLMADDVGNWGEILGLVSIATESLVVLLTAIAVYRSRTRAPASMR